MKKTLFALLLLNINAYAEEITIAEGGMNATFIELNKVITSQNQNLTKIINLDKKNLLEDMRSIFLLKQRNELIMNESYIEGMQ